MLHQMLVLVSCKTFFSCWTVQSGKGFIHSVLLLLLSRLSCPTLQPHRQQPTRLPRPWDSPGKNTGVGCHFLLQCMEVKSESEVAQSCLTPSNPMDCSLPGSSIHGICQARVLEWSAIAFSEYYSLVSNYLVSLLNFTITCCKCG